MAKILFASVPLSGHVLPAVELAAALQARGHQLCFYTGSRYGEVLKSAGICHFPLKRARDYDDRNIRKSFPGLPRQSLLRHAKFYMREVFVSAMKDQYDDLMEIAEGFTADVLISDEWLTAGSPFALQKKIPLVVYGNSPLMLMNDEIPAPGSGLFPDASLYGRNRNRIVNFLMKKILFRDLQSYYNRMRISCGAPPVGHFFLEHNSHAPDLLIKFHTPAFEFPFRNLPENIVFAGPVVAQSVKSSHLPESFISGSKPLVFITQGSVDNYNYSKLIIPALRALDGIHCRVVVATGQEDNHELKSRFPGKNVCILPYIPYAEILPYTSLMITNGGYGGVVTALYHGVPLIVAGNSEDKPVVASRVEWTGCGISLNTGKPGIRSLRKAILRIMEEPSYREKAQEISDDFRKQDGIRNSVEQIEKLIGGKL